MKKFVTVVLSLAFIATGSLFADVAKGEKIYKKKGCSSCHHPTKDQLASGMGPSYQMVAAAYKKDGGKDALVTFLKGKGKPIVAPKKFSTMKGQLRNTKRLSDEERSDLADFILSH
jgi:cytochrome c